MKKVKIALMFIVVLFATNSLVAQNDSIYGGEMKVVDELANISFYSTYEIDSILYIHIDFYDKNSNEFLENTEIIRLSNGIFASKFGEFYVENISEGLNKMIISNAILSEKLQSKPLKIELYMYGKGFTSNNLKSNGKSNVITFFFEPTVTLVEEDINLVYPKEVYIKYFLLSGKEVKRYIYNTPFFEVKYNDNKIMSVEKRIIIN